MRIHGIPFAMQWCCNLEQLLVSKLNPRSSVSSLLGTHVSGCCILLPSHQFVVCCL
jgi:hypothetical protein